MVLCSNLLGSRIATFSDDYRYRYILVIKWDETRPTLASIGLNPSTADHEKDDSTVYRDRIRAADLGFGSLLKLNLFPFRATDPREMKSARDPYGEHRNPERIVHVLDVYRPKMIVAAWGNHGTHLGRSDAFRKEAREAGLELHAYKINQTGEPVHPLYEPYSLKPEIYGY